MLHGSTRWSICEATSAEPCGFVVPTGPLLGHHTRQAALESHRHFMDSVQVPVVQHPPELQLTCRSLSRSASQTINKSGAGTCAVVEGVSCVTSKLSIVDTPKMLHRFCQIVRLMSWQREEQFARRLSMQYQACAGLTALNIHQLYEHGHHSCFLVAAKPGTHCNQPPIWLAGTLHLVL